MTETPQIDHLPASEEAPPADPAKAPKLETPLIHMQDVEHQPSAATRMNTKGVKVTPRLDSEDPFIGDRLRRVSDQDVVAVTLGRTAETTQDTMEGRVCQVGHNHGDGVRLTQD